MRFVVGRNLKENNVGPPFDTWNLWDSKENNPKLLEPDSMPLEPIPRDKETSQDRTHRDEPLLLSWALCP